MQENENLKFDQEDVVRAYLVKRDIPYYRRVFQKLEKRPIPISFNMWAFFFAVQWLFFRRLFGLGILYLVGGTVVGYMTKKGLLSVFVLILYNLAWTPFMNYFYKRSIDKKAEKVLKMRTEERSRYLKKYKGVSWGFFIFSIVMLFLIYIFMMFQTLEHIKLYGI
ncbi:MAG: hypothetical protein Q4A75_00260 [Peptostreptococcaceae bacterium]|nr:hypothetical protein [Peptostreptococcaceae bacterium]